MRPARIITVVVFAAAIAVTGCAAHSAVQPSPAPSPPVVDQGPTSVMDYPAPAPAPAPAPTPAPAPRPLHFATPQASMRYLAAAYNRNDLAALQHVTTPVARNNLLLMRRNASNLQLVGCTANAARGDYTCAFTHDFPAATHRSGHGQAHFTVAPADRPGWYMTVLEDCD
jgi:hypothetical protein